MPNDAHTTPDSRIDALRQPCPERAIEVRLPLALIEEIERERVQANVSRQVAAETR
jgi:hypothetical protein